MSINRKQTVRNTAVRDICVIGVFSALSVVLAMLIHLPLIPSVAFLEYDPADIPIFLISGALGPIAGLIMTAVVSVIQGITVSASSGWTGILMHFLATGFFVLAECLVLRLMRKKNISETLSMICAMGAGVVTMTVVMMLWNLIFTPFFMHMSLQDFLPFLPYIVLFNVLKAAINGAAAFILWRLLRRPIEKYLPRN